MEWNGMEWDESGRKGKFDKRNNKSKQSTEGKRRMRGIVGIRKIKNSGSRKCCRSQEE